MKMDNGRRRQQRITDLIFLPLTSAFFVLGAGILGGAFFRDNTFLNGSRRLIIGLVLTIYGLVRSAMIVRRLVGGSGSKEDE